MTGDIKLVIGVVMATAFLLIGAVVGLSVMSDGENAGPDLNIDKVVIRDENYNSKGTDNPKVKLVVFSDFQCPACKASAPVLNQIIETYADQVRLTYQHFPLPQHTQSQLAAQAVEAAGVQGKFWEMHDALFENQDLLNKETIIEIAEQIGLDLEQFNSDIDSNNHREKIMKDLAEANRLNLTGTPSILINNELYTGPRDFASLSRVVEDEILSMPTIDEHLLDSTGDKLIIEGTQDTVEDSTISTDLDD